MTLTNQASPSDSCRWIQTELAAEMYVDDRVDGQGRVCYLDKVDSVSALIEIENDYDYEPTHIELNELFVDPQDVRSVGCGGMGSELVAEIRIHPTRCGSPEGDDHGETA